MTVSLEWKVSTTASIATLGAGARVNGAAVGSELVNTAEPLADTTQTFTVPGLTRAQLLNGAFTVRVRATRGNSNTAFTASLDAVSVTVDYTVPGAVTLTTNANGNLVARGPDTFAYDGANRLTSATVAGATETYAYDGDGVRFSRTVGAGPAIRSVSDVNTSLPVTLDDGTRTYVWGLGLAYAVSGSSIELYHADRLGSVRAITDAAGAVTATYRTDEYGIVTQASGASGQPYGFTGEPRDGTGLSYLRARYYDPTLGRFMSRDSWAGVPTGPATLHRYIYAGNNPATVSDPSGHCWPVCFAAVGAAIGGLIGGAAYTVTHLDSWDAGGFGGSVVGGAVAGAITAVAGPVGGSVGLALSGSATGAVALVTTVGISAAGGAAGTQVTSLWATGQPASVGDTLQGALVGGAGGYLAGVLFPFRGVFTAAQARYGQVPGRGVTGRHPRA